MTAYEYNWDTTISDALMCANPHGPVNLMTVLGKKKNPWERKDHAENTLVQNAHRTDLGAIYQYGHSNQPLADDDRVIWVDRLAWLLAELEACTDSKFDFGKLAVVLAVSRAFMFDKCIWERLPTRYLSNNLFACMSALVGATQCSFTSRGYSEPIWEREVVDRFQQSDEAEDWPTLVKDWQTIMSAFWPDVNLQEATACLCVSKQGQNALAIAVDQFSSMAQVMNVANGMTSIQIADLAPQLKSRRTRFGFIQSLAFNHLRNEALPVTASKQLALLFQDVQSDSTEWQKWMNALNCYPVRSNALQTAFGLSLVGASTETKSIYVGAIDLSTYHGDCRIAASECLASFKENAGPDERKQFWTIIYKCWSEWSFGVSDQNVPLTCMAVSELDYGVLGYFLENLTEEQRKADWDQTYAEMMVSNEWHADKTAWTSEWYRALSKWQLIQYAQQIPVVIGTLQ